MKFHRTERSPVATGEKLRFIRPHISHRERRRSPTIQKTMPELKLHLPVPFAGAFCRDPAGKYSKNSGHSSGSFPPAAAATGRDLLFPRLRGTQSILLRNPAEQKGDDGLGSSGGAPSPTDQPFFFLLFLSPFLSPTLFLKESGSRAAIACGRNSTALCPDRPDLFHPVNTDREGRAQDHSRSRRHLCHRITPFRGAEKGSEARDPTPRRPPELRTRTAAQTH